VDEVVTETVVFPSDCDTTIFEQFLEHDNNQSSDGDNLFRSGMELLNLLRRAKAPLYLFDQIIKWIKRSIYQYDIDFKHIKGMTRKTVMEKARKHYDMGGLHPQIIKVSLIGVDEDVDLVVHDFKQCLYSILTDKELMNPINLLLSEQNQLSYIPPKRHQIIDDIHTGKCYKMAYQKYISDPSKELLCPIIFFIDKTHTDIHGRLCLEPVQFTLGIFNRETRGKPRAWRTLGYISDNQRKPNDSYADKLKDYHVMLSKILETFKQAQKAPIIWKFLLRDGSYKIYAMKIPVLFIIGDTEGQDKLCGRYSCLKNPKRLCRYCNCPFEETDNPYAKFSYTKQHPIERLIERGDEISLKRYSMHCIENAWHGIDFCDPDRGIYGATLAEVLHCIQLGLFEYAIKALFQQKKIIKCKKRKREEYENVNDDRKSESDDSSSESSDEESDDDENESNSVNSESDIDEDNEEENDDESRTSNEDENQFEIDSSNSEPLIMDEKEKELEPIMYKYSKNYVFPKSYCGRFEALCKKIGRTIQHQSDRNKCRTYFNSSHLSICKKNVHEMAGLLLVYLLLFTSDEGYNV
jgi:hypothetical protein